MSFYQKFGIQLVGQDLASRHIKKVNSEMSSLTKTTRVLTTTLAGIGGGIAGQGVMQLADQVELLDRKLVTSTNSMKEFSEIRKKLLSSADKIGVEFNSVATIYQRMSQSREVIKATSEETLRLAETFLRLGVIGGATGEEIRATSIQFSQALGTGVLRGEELRSVVEQMPLVADVVAQAFGITRGQLKEFGEQGLLSSDVIVKAMLSIADATETEFKKIKFTFQETNSIFMNSSKLVAKEVVSQLQLFEAYSNGLGKASQWITENIAGITYSVSVAGKAIALFAGVALINFTSGMAMAGVEMIGVTNLFKSFGVAVDANTQKLSTYVHSVTGLKKSSYQARTATYSLAVAQEVLARSAGLATAAVRGLMTAMGGIIKAGLWLLMVVGVERLNEKFLIFEKAVVAVDEAITTLFTSFGLLYKAFQMFVNGDFSKGWSEIKKIGKVAVDATKNVKKMWQEIDRNGKISKGVTIPPVNVKVPKAQQIADLDEINIPKNNSASDIINQSLGEGEPATWWEAVIKGLDDFNTQITSTGIIVSDVMSAMNSAMNKTTDAFVQLATTGKFNFKSLTDSIISDMVRMTVQQQITRPLFGLISAGISDWFSGAFGSGTSYPTMNGNVFHTGGIAGAGGRTKAVSPLAFANAPRYHVGGIAGNEVPAILERGEEILPEYSPRHRKNYKGGGGVIVNVNVENSEGVTSEVRQQRETGSDGVERMTLFVKNTVHSMFANTELDGQIAGANSRIL